MRGISANTDLRAMGANFAIARSTREIEKSYERLSTGQRINRAADDPAGLVAVVEFDGRAREIRERIKNLEQQEASFGARDGAMSVVSDQILELQALVLAAASPGGLSDEERDALQAQADAILDGINFVTQTTTFKGQQLLAGYNTNNIGGAGEESLAALRRGGKLNLLSGDLEKAQEVVDEAVNWASASRASLGSFVDGMESERRTLQVELENVLGARSLIADTDYAAETSNLVRNQILQQSELKTREIATNLHRDTVMALLEGVGVKS
jgi:flagellin